MKMRNANKRGRRSQQQTITSVAVKNKALKLKNNRRYTSKFY